MPAFQNPQRGPFARHGEACDDPSAAIGRHPPLHFIRNKPNGSPRFARWAHLFAKGSFRGAELRAALLGSNISATGIGPE
jgi:hypothetical protein